MRDRYFAAVLEQPSVVPWRLARRLALVQLLWVIQRQTVLLGVHRAGVRVDGCGGAGMIVRTCSREALHKRRTSCLLQNETK